MNKIILHIQLLFLRMLYIMQLKKQVITELVFFVLVQIRKLVEWVITLKLLIFNDMRDLCRNIEFSVSGLKFSVFEKISGSKEFSVSVTAFSKK